MTLIEPREAIGVWLSAPKARESCSKVRKNQQDRLKVFRRCLASAAEAHAAGQSVSKFLKILSSKSTAAAYPNLRES